MLFLKKLPSFRKVFWSFFLAPFIFLCPIIGYQVWHPISSEPPLSYDTANAFHVYDQDDRFIGTIFGSMHSHFSENELKPWQERIQKQLPNTEYIFFESDLPHWSMMHMGLERALLQKIEQYGYQHQNIAVLPMEKAESQVALVTSIKRIGPYLYVMPWGSWIDHHSYFVRNCNTWVDISFAIPNLIYNFFINPDIVLQWQKEQAALVTKMREGFLSGRAIALENKEVAPFRIKERDTKMYATIRETLKNNQKHSSEQFIAVIGMLHLSFKEGLLSHFIADGYRLEEAPVIVENFA